MRHRKTITTLVEPSRFTSDQSHTCASVLTANGKFWLFLSLIVLLSTVTAKAQSVPAQLTLDDCVKLAKTAPSSVKRARQQLRSAQFGVRGAKAAFLPDISIANTFVYNSPLLYDHNQFSYVALNGIHEYNSVANANLEVDVSGRVRALYDRAQANRHAAEASLAISDRDLERAVATSYYRVLLTRKLAESAQANLATAQDFEKKVRALVKGEEASNADLNKAILESATLERTWHAMQLESELANHELASYWTQDVSNPLVLTANLDEDLPAPLLPESPNGYLERPELRIFKAQSEGFDADARQARSKMLPQLNLNFQYGIDSNHVTWRDRGYAGYVHLNIPVFDFLKARSEQQQLHWQALQSRTDLEIGKRQFSKEYQDALATVQDIYAQIAIAARGVTAARENLRLSRIRFDGGEGTALDVVTAQSSLVQAEIDFYSTRANYLNAQLALKVASGK